MAKRKSNKGKGLSKLNRLDKKIAEQEAQAQEQALVQEDVQAQAQEEEAQAPVQLGTDEASSEVEATEATEAMEAMEATSQEAEVSSSAEGKEDEEATEDVTGQNNALSEAVRVLRRDVPTSNNGEESGVAGISAQSVGKKRKELQVSFTSLFNEVEPQASVAWNVQTQSWEGGNVRTGIEKEEDINEMAKSILSVGLLRPLCVKENPLFDNKDEVSRPYILVDGHRRYKALCVLAESAGLHDASIVPTKEQEALRKRLAKLVLNVEVWAFADAGEEKALSLGANQSKSRTPFDLAVACVWLIQTSQKEVEEGKRKKAFTQKQITRILGTSTGIVSRYVKTLESMTDEEKVFVQEGRQTFHSCIIRYENERQREREALREAEDSVPQSGHEQSSPQTEHHVPQASASPSESEAMDKTIESALKKMDSQGIPTDEGGFDDEIPQEEVSDGHFAQKEEEEGEVPQHHTEISTHGSEATDEYYDEDEQSPTSIDGGEVLEDVIYEINKHEEASKFSQVGMRVLLAVRNYLNSKRVLPEGELVYIPPYPQGIIDALLDKAEEAQSEAEAEAEAQAEG